MITKINPPLTKDDFDKEPWEKVLSAASEPTCLGFCKPLNTKATENRNAGQERTAQIYILLHAAASLCSSWDSSAEPFRPLFDFGSAGRSPSLEDFGAAELSILTAIAPGTTDPEIRSRIADIAWVLTRHFPMALLAIPAYVETAVRLEASAEFPACVERLDRAVQLALKIHRGTPELLTSVTDAVERIIQKRSDAETKWGCADLMRLLLKAETGEASKYTKLSKELATRAEGRRDWSVARTYWTVEADLHNLVGNDVECRSACIQVAETYVREADSALQRPTPSHGACASLLMRAVEALRKIPGTKARVEELHQRILREQELILPTETSTQHAITDVSSQVFATLSAFRSKPLEQALLGLAIMDSSPSVAEIKISAEESIRSSPWQQIFRTAYLNGAGKLMAERPSAMRAGDDIEALCLRAKMMELMKLHYGLMVTAKIRPALSVINSEHFVRLSDLAFLVRDNPFVPPGREAIFIRGLFAGLNGDSLLATHLLVPQVENSIRHLVYNFAGEPRTSKLRPNLTQPEQDLNELLYREDVKRILQEDLTFDLQTLLITPGIGANFRNNLAHGLLDCHAFQEDAAIYAWWLIWRICSLPELCRLQEAAVSKPTNSEPECPNASPTDPKIGAPRSARDELQATGEQ